MNLTTRIVFDMTTGAVLEEERRTWDGPMAWCKGGGSSTTTVTNTSTPDYAYNARLAGVAERQQNLADTYFNWWQQKQAPVEEATLKSQAELLPLQTEVSKAGLEGLKSVQGSFFKAVQPKSSLLASGQAATDVSRSLSGASAAMARDMSRLGINPASGATAAGMRDLALQGAAMKAGAANTARQQTEDMNLKKLTTGMQFGQS